MAGAPEMTSSNAKTEGTKIDKKKNLNFLNPPDGRQENCKKLKELNVLKENVQM